MTHESKTTSDATDEKELRGTFISVLIIGGLVLLFWLVIFGVYISR